MERVGCSLHNQWGATEVSIDFSFYTCLPEDGLENGIVPVGRPLDNNEIYVLDAHLEPVPVGVAGDLYLAGIGLARGYLNDPARTAEAFIPNPDRPGERMYRTGDRGLYRADGNILFLGRKDDQIKIRGLRVELGEIESVLATHPAVRQCAVVAHKRPDGYYLVAYCVLLPAPAGSDPSWGSTERQRDFLGGLLPQHMVPSRFVAMEPLPTTVSGKVDWKLLPDPGDERPDLHIGAAVPQQVGSEDGERPAQLGDDRLPDVRVGGNAVQQDDGGATAVRPAKKMVRPRPDRHLRDGHRGQPPVREGRAAT